MKRRSHKSLEELTLLGDLLGGHLSCVDDVGSKRERSCGEESAWFRDETNVVAGREVLVERVADHRCDLKADDCFGKIPFLILLRFSIRPAVFI